MAEIQILSKIDNFLNDLKHENQSFPKELVAQLNANAAEVDKAIGRNLITLMVLWFASFGIGIGLIDKGSLGPFSVVKIQQGLIVMPILIGFFYYGMASSGLQSAIYRVFINRIYAHFYPNISEHELDTLLIHPSPFITPERIINTFGISNRNSKSQESLFTKVYALSILLIPLIAFIHVSVISWISGSWFWLIMVASIIIGIIFVVRSYYMWFLAGSIT